MRVIVFRCNAEITLNVLWTYRRVDWLYRY